MSNGVANIFFFPVFHIIFTYYRDNNKYRKQYDLDDREKEQKVKYD